MAKVNVKIAKSTRCNGDYSLYVTFDFDMRIVEVIRSFSTKFWNAEDKIWELPLNKLTELTTKIDWCEFDITADEYVTLDKPEVKVPDNFKFKTNPYDHQIVGFNYGLQNDRWLLGDEMGLGKTKQVIDIAVAKKLIKGYKHCLIVCGVNGLKWNWRNEVYTHSNESAYILGQKVKGNKISIGSNKDKLNDVKNLANIDSYFIITNVETLRDEAINEELQKLCKDGTIGMIAFDECHKAKNPTTQQGKGILKLQAETMIAMTGTPLMNNPMDLYIILKWLGYEKHAFYSFKKHYCVMGGFGGYEIVGYKNLDELQEQLDDIMLRRKKEEVLNLPEKTYIEEYVEMSAAQRKIYNEVTDEIKDNIDQISIAPNPLAELIRMRQATGFTGILSSTVQESAKLDRMEELVEEAKENGKKVVIFSNWTQMTDVIYTRLTTKGFRIAQITGETPDAQRQSIVENFQTGRYDAIIGTSGAMGTGLTLTAGTVEIFLDEPWNMALKEQCVDRCHRIGQKDNLTIYTLMCKDTIDERIHEIVEQKGEMANAIVDGKVTMNNKELLNYLLS
ncbi:MAG: DEAD/DEAH box helicase [Treponema sp.]|nr:DEAD/DEAH box helicase [Treponema sp.]